MNKEDMKMEKMDWFEMWKADRESMLDTMVRNMASDLENGYDYFGKSITRQREEIEQFKAEYEADLDKIGEMDERRVNHWCHIRLLKLGAIQ